MQSDLRRKITKLNWSIRWKDIYTNKNYDTLDATRYPTLIGNGFHVFVSVVLRLQTR